MTNEQTALLLKQLARRIVALANEIESNIKDGDREFERVWIGEGDKPPLPGFAPPFGLFGSPMHPYYQPDNWQMQPVGQFVAVSKVLDFAKELEDEALDLLIPLEPKAPESV